MSTHSSEGHSQPAAGLDQLVLTRRRFTAATAAALAMTAWSCDGQAGSSQTQPTAKTDEENKDKANLATEPFLIGPLDRYQTSGIYPDYKAEKGVWIISDGAELVVLSATCTHLACTTKLAPDQQHFFCPCHESRFDLGGINLSGKAKRPLERCALRVVDGQVEVDPTRRFRQDKGEWPDPASSLSLG